MGGDQRAQIDGSNVPDNPLNSFRMSMTAHGFNESTHDQHRWNPTLNPWIRPSGLRPLPRLAVWITVLLIIAVVAAAILV